MSPWEGLSREAVPPSPPLSPQGPPGLVDGAAPRGEPGPPVSPATGPAKRSGATGSRVPPGAQLPPRCSLVGSAWGSRPSGTCWHPWTQGREGKRVVGTPPALQRGRTSPSHGVLLPFLPPQGDGEDGLPGPPGRPGDPGDRVSVPGRGKVGGDALPPREVTSLPSSAGPAGTARGAGQEGECCEGAPVVCPHPPAPFGGEKGFRGCARTCATPCGSCQPPTPSSVPGRPRGAGRAWRDGREGEVGLGAACLGDLWGPRGLGVTARGLGVGFGISTAPCLIRGAWGSVWGGRKAA